MPEEMMRSETLLVLDVERWFGSTVAMSKVVKMLSGDVYNEKDATRRCRHMLTKVKCSEIYLSGSKGDKVTRKLPLSK